jgi:hypothetical protein
MKAQRGSRGTALASFNLSAKEEWVVNAMHVEISIFE